MARVHCVGSMNMDIAAYSARLPRPGETVMGDAIASSPGGKGLNQAVAARRLGATVSFTGNLGTDATGDALAAFLAEEGIDTRGVVRVATTATGAAIILVDAKSENAIVVIPGANMAWSSRELSRFAPAAGDLVVAQFEIPDAVIAEAFAKARGAGSRTILNAAPARAIPATFLPLIDILIVNETELAAATGRAFDPADLAAVTAAAKSLASGGMAVVATLGAAGALVVTKDQTVRIDGVAVKAIDTAGAGDCFIGAFAAALARGDDLATAAHFGNRAASVSVTRKGTAIAMPRSDEVARNCSPRRQPRTDS